MRYARWLLAILTGLTLASALVTRQIAHGQTLRLEIADVVLFRATSVERAALHAIVLAALTLVCWLRLRAAPAHATGLATVDRGTSPEVAEASHGDADGDAEADWRQACVWGSAALAGLAGLIVAGFLAWSAYVGVLRPVSAFGFGDGALTELYTHHAAHGVWGLGAYSRFGWHHPGPLSFYLIAPFYIASGGHALGMAAGAAVIGLLALVAAAAGLCRHARPATTIAICAGLALYLHRLPAMLTSTWNPHLLLLPYAALILLAAIVARGCVGWLPIVLLLASFVTQTHVGLAPCAAAVVLCAIVAGDRQAFRRAGLAGRRAVSRAMERALLLMAVVWFPPVHQMLSATPGNLPRLVAFFLSGDANSGLVPAREAFRAWVGTLMAPWLPGFFLAGGGEKPFMPEGWFFAALVLSQIALLLVSGQWAARRALLVEAWLCRMTLVASLAGLLAISRIRGGLGDHLVFWNTVPGLLNVSVLASMAMAWLARRDGRDRRAMSGAVTSSWPAWARRVMTLPIAPSIAPLGAWVIASAIVLGAAASVLLRLGLPSAAAGARRSAPPVERLYLATRRAIAHARLSRPLIVPDGDWSNAAGIILQLRTHQVDFGVARGAVWMFGAPLAERGDERGKVIVANGERTLELMQEPGNCLIAFADRTFVHLRTPDGEPPASVRCLSIDEATR